MIAVWLDERIVDLEQSDLYRRCESAVQDRDVRRRTRRIDRIVRNAKREMGSIAC